MENPRFFPPTPKDAPSLPPPTSDNGNASSSSSTSSAAAGNNNPTPRGEVFWVDDAHAPRCQHKTCGRRGPGVAPTPTVFGLLSRRHHCRHCGLCVCWKCSKSRRILPGYADELQRVCDSCALDLVLLLWTSLTESCGLSDESGAPTTSSDGDGSRDGSRDGGIDMGRFEAALLALHMGLDARQVATLVDKIRRVDMDGDGQVRGRGKVLDVVCVCVCVCVVCVYVWIG